MSSKSGNILLVWDRVGDYHIARYQALKHRFENGSVWLADLGAADALYGWENALNNSPYYKPLSSQSVEKNDFFNRFKNFRNLVHSADVQYIGLSGYGRKEYLAFLIWAAFKRKRVILFAESWYGNSGWLNAVKGFLLKITCSGFLVSGTRARLHFKEKLGLGNLPFEMGYSVVDNRHFESGSTIPKENTLLCVARFAPEKNLELLIAAFQKSNLRGKWNLQLVGGGPLKNTLLNQISSDSDITLHDWLSYKALPNLYAQAKVFILPSLFEPWGLVVNEAMSAGLPVIVSSVCGCQPDLVDAENGFVFEAQNQQALTQILNQLDQLTDQKITEMGENSRLKMQAFSPEVWANNFLKLALG